MLCFAVASVAVKNGRSKVRCLFFTLKGNRCVGCVVSELKILSLPPTSKELAAGVKDINDKQLENKARSWTCQAVWLKDSLASTILCKRVCLQNARQRCVNLDGY